MKTRFDELYELGTERYHAFMDNELGENNALLAAVATMLADSETKSYWRPAGPCLVPDENLLEAEATQVRPTEIIHTGIGTQLTLGDW